MPYHYLVTKMTKHKVEVLMVISNWAFRVGSNLKEFTLAIFVGRFLAHNDKNPAIISLLVEPSPSPELQHQHRPD